MTGLIGWWPLNENTGQARDLSGNNNHGNLNGGITRGVAGKQGTTAYSFDGSDDFVKIKSAPLSNNPISWFFWIKTTASGSDMDGSNANIAQYREIGSSGDRVASMTLTKDGKFQAGGFDSDASTDRKTVEGTTTINDGNWHLVGVTVNGDNWKIYVDGQKEGSMSWIGRPTADDISLGSDMDDSGNLKNTVASIQTDHRIYNRALTSSEAKKLYQQGSQDYTQPRYHNGRDTGAVSRWKFNGDVTDSWGTNDGSDNTSAGYTNNAIRGKAKKFDGTDDWINLGNPSNLNFGSGDFTVASWFKADANGGRILMNRTNDTSGYDFFVNGNNEIAFLIDNNGTNESVDSSRNVLGDWHHAAALRRSGTIELYLNGALIDTISSSGDASSSEDAVIGAWNSSGTLDNYWDGKIDDLRVYNRALKPYEVFQLYQHGTKGIDLRKTIVNQRG